FSSRRRHTSFSRDWSSDVCSSDLLIEVTHGDGLGGSSVNYGFPAHSDEEYLGAVIPLMKQAKVSALLLPGIGTVEHLKMAHELRSEERRVGEEGTRLWRGQVNEKQ